MPTNPTSDLEIHIQGMDCADCTRHVQQAIQSVPGVQAVDVYLGSEKAVVQVQPAGVDLTAIEQAVAQAGYKAVLPGPAAGAAAPADPTAGRAADLSRQVLRIFGLVFIGVLAAVVLGEWLGLFERLTERVPLAVGALLVLIAGYPVFQNVARSALRGRIISHTLMSVGVAAALLVGQWATALLVVFFMRVGDAAERFTTDRARGALRSLAALAPRTARVLRAGIEHDISAGDVLPGDVVVVRPGEKIPVDGQVISGQATLDNSAITGESMPVEAGPGTNVYAAALASLGSLQIRATSAASDTTFARVIRLVEEAEGRRADVQRMADRFSTYFLPVVALIAGLTFVLRRDPLAAAAVLVVACSCSLALATPIAILASIGAAAHQGILFKGGRGIEALARASVLLVDKTGTLTLGKPRITRILPLNGLSEDHLLALAAGAERYSEHPLAEAVRGLARERGVPQLEASDFQSRPGSGVQAVVAGQLVEVISPRSLTDPLAEEQARQLSSQGLSVLVVRLDQQAAGLLAASDQVRPELSQALAELRALGFEQIEILTGDNPQAASALAGPLGLHYQASLLPEDKINVVRAYQSAGKTVIMVGDGVNDAPALAQADIGVAMGAAGTDIANEAAQLILLRDDWRLLPAAIRIARRTMGVVRGNLWFTGLYNLVGLSLAALGFLPPVLAAAAQSLPDLGILANSTRLLRQPESSTPD